MLAKQQQLARMRSQLSGNRHHKSTDNYSGQMVDRVSCTESLKAVVYTRHMCRQLFLCKIHETGPPDSYHSSN